MKILLAIILLLGVSHSNAAKAFRGAMEQSPSTQRKLQQPLGLIPQILAINDAYEVVQGEKLKVYAPGILANDTTSFSTLFVSSHATVGVFTGKLKVKEDGKIEYTHQDDFVGTEQFTYTACQVAQPLVCSTATVSLTVKRDPNKPNANPTAINDSYQVTEGFTLEEAAPGFLGNDLSGTPSNPLERCDRRGSTTGSLDTHQDGSFEYTAERCSTGSDTFTYMACYKDYEDMESDYATVTIEVIRDPGRPEPPGVQDDSYTVYDGEVLEVSSDNGLLWNDAGGETLYVNDEEEQSGFEGNLDVSSSGAFTYTPVQGKLGTYIFTYEVCFDDWECVDCRTATVRIEVQTNPNKPTSPPTPVEDSYEVELGERLQIPAPGILDNDDADDRYTLTVTNYDTGDGFVGIFNGESDGSFEFGNGPVGEATVTYTVCYKEWPDLCANGQVKIDTKSSVPLNSDSSSRRGVATFYEINWAGRPETECEAIEPSLTLSCRGDGELNLLDVGLSEYSICTKSVDGNAYCAAKHSGVVFAECRDGRANNASKRELDVEMHSQPVDCGATMNAPLYWTYHAMWLNTWCNNSWVNRGINCTGTVLEDGSGASLCYEDHKTLGENAQPANITMRSTSYEQCFVGAGSQSLAPLPRPVALALAGNDGDPVSAFPLQACQGDCDDDSDCSSDLICFQRDGNEVVPGCVGTPESGKDYCIIPPPEPVVIKVGPDLVVSGNDGDPSSGFPLQECQGDCDSDSDCSGNLICFQRSSGDDIVPGCTGEPESDRDYCIKPIAVVASRGGPDLFP